MTEQELAQIEERADRATPGPWEFSDEGRPEIISRGESSLSGYPRRLILDVPLHMTDETAAFIAHSREDVPRLITEIRRLQKRDLILHQDAKEGCELLAAENARLREHIAGYARALDELGDMTIRGDIPLAPVYRVMANAARNALEGK